MQNQENIIILNDEFFIGEGRNRKCYIHPLDKNLCIKVSSKKGKRSAKREINYFKRLHRRGKSFEMISDYVGMINTNIGEGDLYELVRDYDGTISRNLEYYLALDNKNITAKMVELVEDLRQYLINEYILISDLDLDNILIQKESENNFKLIVIDGIGDNNQISFLEYFKPLGTKRSIKKWGIFKMRIIKEFPNLEKSIKEYNE
jgi:hypothetical protein